MHIQEGRKERRHEMQKLCETHQKCHVMSVMLLQAWKKEGLSCLRFDGDGRCPPSAVSPPCSLRQRGVGNPAKAWGQNQCEKEVGGPAGTCPPRMQN